MTEEKFEYICNLREEIKSLKSRLDEVKARLDLQDEDNTLSVAIVDPTNRFEKLTFISQIFTAKDALNIYYDRLLAFYEFKKKEYEKL